MVFPLDVPLISVWWDGAISVGLVILGIFIVLQAERKWGWIVAAFGLWWASAIFLPIVQG